jgi:site-specific DNA-methyltransferase (adenine-specific)
VQPYYEDEWVTIYHADSFDLLHDLGGIGAVITDPPYSSGGAFRGDRAQQTTTKYVNSDTATYRPEFAGDNRDQRSFLAWSALWLNAARKASKPGAVLASFIDWRQLPVLTDAVQAGGWTWRNLATWWKPGTRMQKGRFSASAEYVIYATNGPVVEGAGSPQNVYSCKIDSDREHIAQKPAKVMRWVM